MEKGIAVPNLVILAVAWISFTFTVPQDPVMVKLSPPLRAVATVMDEYGVVADTIAIYSGPSTLSGPPILGPVGSSQTIWLWCNPDSITRRLRVGTVGHTNVWSLKSNAVDFAAGLSPFGAVYWDPPFYDAIPSSWDGHTASFAHSTFQDPSGIWCVKFRIGNQAETVYPTQNSKGVSLSLPHIRITGRP